MEQLVRLIFSTHFYEWEGKLYRQVSGGPIGLRATGMVARVIMDFWVDQIYKRAEQCRLRNIEDPQKYVPVHIHALWKYVDDCVSVMSKIKLGSRWSKPDKAMI